MTESATFISWSLANAVIIALAYFTVCAICFWRLMPALSPIAKRIIIGFLTLQALLIVVSLLNPPLSDFWSWLWNLRWEYNFPSVFAATQLATVAGFALFAAQCGKVKPVARRFSLLALGLLFAVLAADDFFDIYYSIASKIIEPWYLGILALAVLVAAGTALASIRSTALQRIRDTALIASMVILAAAGFVLDKGIDPCFTPGLANLQVCRIIGRALSAGQVEESFELLGAFLALVAVLGVLSEAIEDPTLRLRRLMGGFPLLVALLLLTYAVLFGYGFDELRHIPLRLSARLALHNLSEQVSVRFETEIHLQGYAIEIESEAISTRLYSSAGENLTSEFGYSLHLIDQFNHFSLASRDEDWCCPSTIVVIGPDCRFKCKPRRIYPDWLADEPVYTQSLDIDVPRSLPSNRALWLVLTLWRERDGEYVRQKVRSSDLPLLDETQVIVKELVLPAETVPATSAPLASFDGGFALESVEMPNQALSGEMLDISFSWRADQAGEADAIQFLHLGNEATGEWFVYDQAPLGQRLPTRLWYSGLADSETWQVPLPADLAPGRYMVFTGLYRASDLERVHVSDADGIPWLDNRVELGMLRIENV